MHPYPLLFHPLLKPRVWGGRSLESLGKQLPPNTNIGESWEIADLPDQIPDGRSIIANGQLAGLTLRQAMAAHHKLIMGDGKLSNDSGFPLLIKFLDAQENLSVQVHPDENYAAKNPSSHLKSEAWVVVRAQPGAVIYKDIKPGVTAQQFTDHIHNGTVINDLVAVPVKPGDCHYLPSGTCHALGAGVLVAEIQTPSDTTFRVYDWGRTGKGRELHLPQALQCIHFGGAHTSQSKQRAHQPIEVNSIRTTSLCETDYFTIERIDALQPASFQIVTNGLPEVWMMIVGTARLHTKSGSNIQLSPGVTALLPAEMTDATIYLQPASWLLRVKLPSQLRGKIAGKHPSTAPKTPFPP